MKKKAMPKADMKKAMGSKKGMPAMKMGKMPIKAAGKGKAGKC